MDRLEQDARVVATRLIEGNAQTESPAFLDLYEMAKGLLLSFASATSEPHSVGA
jgi:hypothetical protein